MYVSYLLDPNLAPQGFPPGPPGVAAPPPSYLDFPGYPPEGQGGGAGWSDWGPYGHAQPNPGPLACFGSPSDFQGPGGAGPAGGPVGGETRRNPYDWMRRNAPPLNPGGKTRTKDKYRVVYTDHQRLELEKEFHYSRYITIRRKAELAATLSLSERQVKIWFQNRRAKERKMTKKKLQQPQASSSTGGDPLVSSSVSMPIKEEF